MPFLPCALWDWQGGCTVHHHYSCYYGQLQAQRGPDRWCSYCMSMPVSDKMEEQFRVISILTPIFKSFSYFFLLFRQISCNLGKSKFCNYHTCCMNKCSSVLLNELWWDHWNEHPDQFAPRQGCHSLPGACQQDMLGKVDTCFCSTCWSPRTLWQYTEVRQPIF